MRKGWIAVARVLAAVAAGGAVAAPPWTVHVANDNCPDYTWGLTEEATRQAFADVVRGHLDEMTRTDAWPDDLRDRYNAAVTQEILCFLEKHPDRRDELIRRIREGRLFVSPFLCNSLWGFQGAEAFLRTLYPARRLEREFGVRFDAAEHIELPSLPWGVATLLAGADVRWLSVPFYNYDSTFGSLATPPIFDFEGPDGSRVRVAMDPWACNRKSYQQGREWTKDPSAAARAWLPHYESLGDAYPGGTILASGTHGDISPGSGAQARGFADAIRDGAGRAGDQVRIVNAALPQFFAAVDSAVASAGRPLPVVRGCFGHSWEAWPVGLAGAVASMREGERRFLAAEAMLAVAGGGSDDRAATERRHRAEACWSMLSDHAWNGTDAANKQLNARLRRQWAAELNDIAAGLTEEAWRRVGRDAPDTISVFHGLSFGYPVLVRVPAGGRDVSAWTRRGAQLDDEDGVPVLSFLCRPRASGYGFHEYTPEDVVVPTDPPGATEDSLTNGICALRIDRARGTIAGLVQRDGGVELATGPGLCAPEYFDGAPHPWTDGCVEVLARGPVLARVRLTGRCGPLRVRNEVTAYAKLGRLDFDVRVERPASTAEDRFLLRFPVLHPGGTLYAETAGAMLRPAPQPEGDLLPGADPRRFAVQYAVHAAHSNRPSVTLVSLDAFLLRPADGGVTFEAFGSDQNHREVFVDQGGERSLRFRFSLETGGSGNNPRVAVRRAREVSVAMPVRWGGLVAAVTNTRVYVCSGFGLATCLKPADEGPSRGAILRMWSPCGGYEKFAVTVPGLRRAVRTDLLERDAEVVAVDRESALVPIPKGGFAAVRLFFGEHDAGGAKP